MTDYNLGVIVGALIIALFLALPLGSAKTCYLDEICTIEASITNGSLSYNATAADLEVIDSTNGNVVIDASMNEINNSIFSYSFSGLSKGFYIAKVVFDSTYIGYEELDIRESYSKEADFMNIYDILFIIGFFVLLGTTGLKLFNLFRKTDLYDLSWSIMLFIISTLGFGICFIVGILDYSEILFSVLGILVSGVFLLNVIFFFVELMFYVAKMPGERKAFSSMTYWQK